jgi:hypothetical protein
MRSSPPPSQSLPSSLWETDEAVAIDTPATAAAAASAPTSRFPAHLDQYFVIPDFSVGEQSKFLSSYVGYSVAINYTKSDWEHVTAITDSLHLGMLPCTTGFALPQGITAVFSICTYAELAGVGLAGYQPLTPNYYRNKGIEHFFLICPDNSGDAKIEDAIETLRRMRAHLKANPAHKIYLHCKAGCGRSAMFCALYLAIFGTEDASQTLQAANYDLDSVVKYLTQLRPQLNMTNQMEQARNILATYMLKEFPDANLSHAHSPVTYSSIEAYLASVVGKDAIRHFAAFKELAMYASLVKNSARNTVTSFILYFPK